MKEPNKWKIEITEIMGICGERLLHAGNNEKFDGLGLIFMTNRELSPLPLPRLGQRKEKERKKK